MVYLEISKQIDWAMKNKMIVAPAPLDFESCVDMLGGDRAIVLDLLKEFLKNLDNQIKAISTALADANPEMLRTEAHSIKGGAAVLSVYSVMSAAAVLEEIAKSGDLAKGQEGLSVLAREADLLQLYCNELLKRFD